MGLLGIDLDVDKARDVVELVWGHRDELVELLTRLPDLLGLPEWAVLAALVAIAALGFALGSRLERARGGPLTAQEVCAEDTETLATPKGAMARS